MQFLYRLRDRVPCSVGPGPLLPVRVGQPLPLHRGAGGGGEPVQPGKQLLVHHRVPHAAGVGRGPHRNLNEVGKKETNFFCNKMLLLNFFICSCCS